MGEQKRAEELYAANVRLRNALKRIVEYPRVNIENQDALHMQQIAAAALQVG